MIIDDSFVDAVGEAVGHHSGAWDMVDPKEIIRAVLLVAERNKLILPNGDTNDWGKEGWCVPTKG